MEALIALKIQVLYYKLACYVRILSHTAEVKSFIVCA